MQLTLKKITQPNQEFWQSFDQLVNKTCGFTVHLNSIWLTNYIKYYFEETQSTWILAAYNQDELVGCLPLQAEEKRATRFYNFTELRILGFGPTDFFDIPVAEENRQEILSHLVAFLKNDSTWDKLMMTELPETSPNLKCLIEALRKEKLEFELDEPNGFVYTATKGDWEDFLTTEFDPKNKDLAKSERRVAKKGYELKFSSYRENVYPELLKNIDLYAQRRESLGQFNKYETDNLKKFLQNIIEAYEAKKMVELTVLEADGETWAFQLDWICNKTRYHWNHAYNEDYKRYSPGKLILKEVMRSSFYDPNIDYCNHMRGLSSYKDKFTDEKQMLIRIRIENSFSKKVKLTRLISKTLKAVKK
ncbi:GNAT family N-acetyltransferase [Mesonia ostreae]|uniref:GNAT family N-acetyltransferase n=1 Tax=Mesonia ostreae TaxID=861110 RepID=A0ABU2KM11_9FLAO|nr:GNAT family N-acetyltransferase [Mesonia ostreae]MDT0295762.1 GNAT family N-acetyltransferase [Mesonia ostreae]